MSNSSLQHQRHSLFGCQLIQEATKKMSFPPSVMLISQTIFHHFYMRRSFEKTDALTGAMGCFLLGCKVEEVPIALRDTVFIFFELFLERKKLPIRSLEVSNPIFLEWKSELIVVERIILKELGFSLYTFSDQSNECILKVLNSLQVEDADRDEKLTILAESAWHFLIESKRSAVELEYECIVIVCAVFLLASTVHNIKLTPSWWIVLGVDHTAMKEVCDIILDMYDIQDSGATWIEPITSTPIDYQINTFSTYKCQ